MCCEEEYQLWPIHRLTDNVPVCLCSSLVPRIRWAYYTAGVNARNTIITGVRLIPKCTQVRYCKLGIAVVVGVVVSNMLQLTIAKFHTQPTTNS